MQCFSCLPVAFTSAHAGVYVNVLLRKILLKEAVEQRVCLMAACLVTVTWQILRNTEV